MMKLPRKAVLTCSVAVGALAIATGACAQQRAFDIPAQSATRAVPEFARQAGVQIISSGADLRGLQSAPLKGEFDVRIALAQLLDGTGLTWRGEGDTFIIEKASDPQSGSAAGDGADGTVQALIVTAQKREENIQDVPIAMSAFTQEDLTRSQVAGGPDLMTQVPNFTFTKTNFSGYSIQIRGIGTQAISATTDAAVAIAFNNTPFIRNRFFEQEFYDLQRVEVLRGPQGTLYGRNATAGVVNIISAKPKFSYEARLSADVSNYSSSRIEGMLNLPLVDDRVALRIAGAWTKREGYDTNQITGNQIDGRDLWSTRVSLRFTPTEAIDANLIWEHFNEDDDRLRSGKQLCKKDVVTNIGGYPVAEEGAFGGFNPPTYQQFFSQGCAPASLYAPESFQTPNGQAIPYYGALSAIFLPTAFFDPYASRTQSRNLRTIESTVDPQYRAKTDTAELQLRFDLVSDLSLTSETGYNVDELFSMEDYNRFNTAPDAFDQARWDDFSANPYQSFIYRPHLLNNGYFCDPQIGCANRLVAVDLSTARSRQFSQEFRLVSNYSGPLNFSIGANFLRYDTVDKYYVFVNTLTMISAIAPYAHRSSYQLSAYEPNVSDNSDCMLHGLVLADPAAAEEVGKCTYIDPNPISSLNDLGHNYFLSKNPYKLISYAVFGEIYYTLTENLKLTAGLRWTVDKKQAPRIPSWVVGGEVIGYPVAEVVRQKWREPTGRLTLDWKPDLALTDDTLIYASYAHGYKAGGANPPASGLVILDVGFKSDFNKSFIDNAATHPKTFSPEFVNAFELGSKNTLLDGELTLNGNAFYYDYTGYQISEIVDRSAVNLNFDAKVWGLEFESDWRPVENLRLGLKLGYENTRMAKASKAVDFMDRTAGRTDWFVARPFPSLPSNCVLPTYLVFDNGGPASTVPGNAGGGGLGPCELAYIMGVDPVSGATYSPYPTGQGSSGSLIYSGYPGFDPFAGTPGDPYTGQNTKDGHDYGPTPNSGAGFYKDLSGHELPNAPHYTATVTADYTVPLPNDWLATLHTDLYYQSEAWTRVFNTPGYDKLKAYTNVNVAAIFSNEDAGWKIMAYVKNVFDRDAITGAFLNSDDTGLTTNVFLNEPRLYGLRVTKEWTGGPWWTGADPNHTGPYPLTVEVGGQLQRTDAPYSTVEPSFISAFPDTLNRLAQTQHRDLDNGDGRELTLIYKPAGAWSLSTSLRYGRANGAYARLHVDQPGDTGCPWAAKYAVICEMYPLAAKTTTDWADVMAHSREEHLVADFSVGRDLGIGKIGLDKSVVDFGVRYAHLKSITDMTMDGVPDWYLPDGFYHAAGLSGPPNLSTRTEYRARLHVNREFEGAGPVLDWRAALHLLGTDQTGHLDVDWSASGAVLFGKQQTGTTGTQNATFYQVAYGLGGSWIAAPGVTSSVPANPSRTRSVSVPVVDLSLGLSYEIQRIKLSTGYRWERYFNVLDTGYAEHKDADRTIDGPYFKVAVGFGG